MVVRLCYIEILKSTSHKILTPSMFVVTNIIYLLDNVSCALQFPYITFMLLVVCVVLIVFSKIKKGKKQ